MVPSEIIPFNKWYAVKPEEERSWYAFSEKALKVVAAISAVAAIALVSLAVVLTFFATQGIGMPNGLGLASLGSYLPVALAVKCLNLAKEYGQRKNQEEKIEKKYHELVVKYWKNGTLDEEQIKKDFSRFSTKIKFLYDGHKFLCLLARFSYCQDNVREKLKKANELQAKIQTKFLPGNECRDYDFCLEQELAPAVLELLLFLKILEKPFTQEASLEVDFASKDPEVKKNWPYHPYVHARSGITHSVVKSKTGRDNFFFCRNGSCIQLEDLLNVARSLDSPEQEPFFELPQKPSEPSKEEGFIFGKESSDMLIGEDHSAVFIGHASSSFLKRERAEFTKREFPEIGKKELLKRLKKQLFSQPRNLQEVVVEIKRVPSNEVRTEGDSLKLEQRAEPCMQEMLSTGTSA